MHKGHTSHGSKDPCGVLCRYPRAAEATLWRFVSFVSPRSFTASLPRGAGFNSFASCSVNNRPHPQSRDARAPKKLRSSQLHLRNHRRIKSFPRMLEPAMDQNKSTKRGRPNRAAALQRAIAAAGIDPASVDPRRILAALAIDAGAPAGARVQACRVLMASANMQTAADQSDPNVPNDPVSRRALEILARRSSN
jgi:hypothetical protein